MTPEERAEKLVNDACERDSADPYNGPYEEEIAAAIREAVEEDSAPLRREIAELRRAIEGKAVVVKDNATLRVGAGAVIHYLLVTGKGTVYLEQRAAVDSITMLYGTVGELKPPEGEGT